MRAPGACLVGAVMLAAVAAAGQGLLAQPARPHFKSAISLTTVTATVTDPEGRLVARLPRERFELFEDGEPQDITHFTNERVPVSLGILLDSSDSMYGRRISDARQAIYRFVSDMLDPADEFALIAFNHRHQWLTEWTEDRSLAFTLLQPLRPWGATAIYDAIMGALPLAETRHHQRVALLMVSDGADTASDATVRDLRRSLLRTDIFVYAIGVDSPDRRAINAPVNAMALGELTDPSGGRTFIVHDVADVGRTLEQIADELNSQYLIGYSPARKADGRFHSIRVRVRDGEYKVRARSGYVADRTD